MNLKERMEVYLEGLREIKEKKEIKEKEREKRREEKKPVEFFWRTHDEKIMHHGSHF